MALCATTTSFKDQLSRPRRLRRFASASATGNFWLRHFAKFRASKTPLKPRYRPNRAGARFACCESGQKGREMARSDRHSFLFPCDSQGLQTAQAVGFDARIPTTPPVHRPIARFQNGETRVVAKSCLLAIHDRQEVLPAEVAPVIHPMIQEPNTDQSRLYCAPVHNSAACPPITNTLSPTRSRAVTICASLSAPLTAPNPPSRDCHARLAVG